MVRPPAQAGSVNTGPPAAPAKRPASAPSVQQPASPPPPYSGRPAAAAPAAATSTQPSMGGSASAAVASRRADPDDAAGVSPLGTKDPTARAERLARALVSDIVAYHPDRRERSLADGTMRTEFRDEIMKSWDEFVAQVGMDMAKSTPYFRDALNKILAKGQQLF